MTRIIIRAIRDRQKEIAYLKAALPEAEWCFDTDRNAMHTFLRALDMAGNKPCLHMEEDVLLNKYFQPRVELEIAKRPDSIIQFFSMRMADTLIGSRWDSNFSMNVCFYLPDSYSQQIHDYYPKWQRKKEHPTGYDLMMNDWLKQRKEKYYIVVPSLVEHREGVSMISSRRSSKRQSKTFNKEEQYEPTMEI